MNIHKQRPLRGNVKVELDLSNYVTKTEKTQEVLIHQN